MTPCDLRVNGGQKQASDSILFSKFSIFQVDVISKETHGKCFEARGWFIHGTLAGFEGLWK